ncbi:hypothetical protein JCM19275_1616 [Nonlabens ulvanivorans]|uniref:Uncharacterized protein n=1 Tax=Nonlabens ulvanivorans TaxID=906888 RepID=A0A090WHL2_NONUL|nr:hypothetical protein JCM19275_1616 [Nonlabens ulvanivorans]
MIYVDHKRNSDPEWMDDPILMSKLYKMLLTILIELING